MLSFNTHPTNINSRASQHILAWSDLETKATAQQAPTYYWDMLPCLIRRTTWVVGYCKAAYLGWSNSKPAQLPDHCRSLQAQDRQGGVSGAPYSHYRWLLKSTTVMRQSWRWILQDRRKLERDLYFCPNKHVCPFKISTNLLISNVLYRKVSK